MYSFVFRNKVVAVGFVALMAFGAASLVGTEENEGVLLQTAEQIDEARSGVEESVRELNQPAPRPVASAEPRSSSTDENDDNVGFISDDELIDDTAGFDPTPVDEFEQMQVADENEEVMLVVDEQEIE